MCGVRAMDLVEEVRLVRNIGSVATNVDLKETKMERKDQTNGRRTYSPVLLKGDERIEQCGGDTTEEERRNKTLRN